MRAIYKNSLDSPCGELHCGTDGQGEMRGIIDDDFLLATPLSFIQRGNTPHRLLKGKSSVSL